MRHFTLSLIASLAVSISADASQEQFARWTSAAITTEIEAAGGTVTVEAETDGTAFKSLAVHAFGRKDSLGAPDLKKLDGFPLSSMTITHEPGYKLTGGYSVNLRFKRPAAAKQTEAEVIVMVTKSDGTKILTPPASPVKIAVAFEPVAYYTNSEAHHTVEGARIRELLKEAKIEWVGSGSASVSISVNPDDAERARYLLAKAVLAERLDVALQIRPKGSDRWHETTPWEVILRTDLFDSPLHHFEEALVPAMSGSERATVHTTLRGFQIRADTHPGMRASNFEPTERGFFFDASVRDAAEIPEFSDSEAQSGAVTERTVKFPAVGAKRDQALVLTFDHGEKADPAAVRSIEKAIANLRERWETMRKEKR